MAGKHRSGNYVKFLIYLIAIVLINLAGVTLFFRLDLTADKVYSVSAASQKVVATLSEPLTIKVFFTKDLPAPHNQTERYLHDLLEEYAIYANKYFNYRFYDVSPDEGDLTEATRENQQLANNYGIHPIQIQVIEKDEVKFQRAYMGLVLIHGDLIEQIPTITTTDGLEYRLTTAIQKMNNKISALLSLPEKIKIKLYLSSSLETVAPYMGLQELRDLPTELENIVKKLNPQNYGQLDFEHLNPTTAQELEAVAQEYNVMTLNWPALSNGKIPAGRGAIGLVMEYGERADVIPLLQVIRLPILGTQYKLAEMSELEEIINDEVENLIDINTKLAYLSGHGTLNVSRMPRMDPTGRPQGETLTHFRELVSQTYTLKEIDLTEKPIPEGINSLIIARPTESFSDYELFQIDQFLMQGKNIGLFLDSLIEMRPTNQPATFANPQPVYKPLKTGLEKLLEHYGLRLKSSYVLDENCFRQEVPAQLGGGERAIYFAPLIKNQFINKDLAFMQNIKALVAVKISPLELVPDRIQANGVKVHQLLASSEKSWEMKGRINLNPMFLQPPTQADEQHSRPLAYLLEGAFPSYFAGKPIPVKEVAEQNDDKKTADETDTEETPDAEPNQANPAEDSAQKSEIDLSRIQRKGQFLEKGKPGRIFLMASSEMIKDNVLDASGRSSNSTFILNVLDYLSNREDIAVMRSKEQRFNPLEDTKAGTKTAVKTFNIVGLPILVVLFGLLVWLRRHSRKRQIQMMFQK
ncbi:MAG: Gldg family protein [Desulfobacterales bacterium]|nr:MAG: Gldg family protein [Desulfobacterales bacterium]